MILFLYFALISYYAAVFANDDEFRLQILHTNDIHAHFAEMDENCQSCLAEDVRQGRCFGGVARIRQAALDAMAEARGDNVSSLFVNAGDTFQGTPYYKLYKWQIYPFVNSLGFDAIVIN